MALENKGLSLEFKNIKDNGSFEGYAAFFGNIDSWDDIIEAGAFKDTLREHKSKGTMPSLLWQHDSREPIGIWEEMEEDDKGLYVEGTLLKDDVQKAKEAYALLKAGAIKGISIGYWARDYSIDEKTWIRTLKKVDLLEASLVTFPANDKATVTGVKANRIKTIRDFEAALRDVMGFSNNEAKRIASGGFKAREVLTANNMSEEEQSALNAILNKY